MIIKNEAVRILPFNLSFLLIEKAIYFKLLHDANSLNYSSCTHIDATSLNMFIKFHLNNKVLLGAFKVRRFIHSNKNGEMFVLYVQSTYVRFLFFI